MTQLCTLLTRVPLEERRDFAMWAIATLRPWAVPPALSALRADAGRKGGLARVANKQIAQANCSSKLLSKTQKSETTAPVISHGCEPDFASLLTRGEGGCSGSDSESDLLLRSGDRSGRSGSDLSLFGDRPEGDRAGPSSLKASVDRIWAHYRTRRPRARVFAPKTRKHVEARLREGFTADELCEAIDAMFECPHNLGQNEQGVAYLALDLVVRDATQVEKYRAMRERPTVAPAKDRRLAALDQASDEGLRLLDDIEGPPGRLGEGDDE